LRLQGDACGTRVGKRAKRAHWQSRNARRQLKSLDGSKCSGKTLNGEQSCKEKIKSSPMPQEKVLKKKSGERGGGCRSRDTVLVQGS